MKRDRLDDVGELEAIRRLCAHLPSRGDVVTGVGDDCAVLRLPGRSAFDLVLTSDPVVMGTHFDGSAAPEAVGRKAVGRVLSDLAAMGAAPDWALIDLTAPPRTRFSFVEGIYRGAARLARRHGLAIVGGDTARSADLAVHVFAVGHVPRGKALLRSGAGPGDEVFVTGRLGGSRSGRHLMFEPRLREGAWLRESGFATAMIDVSDGLARDAKHIAVQSGVTVRLAAASIPVSRAALALDDGRSPLDHALCDGEDFELLLTVPGRKGGRLAREWRRRFRLPLTRIGFVERGAPSVLVGGKEGGWHEPASLSFEHFGR